MSLLKTPNLPHLPNFLLAVVLVVLSGCSTKDYKVELCWLTEKVDLCYPVTSGLVEEEENTAY